MGLAPDLVHTPQVCLNGACAHVDWPEGNLAGNAMSSSVDPTVAKVCAAAQHTPPLSPTRAMASPSTATQHWSHCRAHVQATSSHTPPLQPPRTQWCPAPHTPRLVPAGPHRNKPPGSVSGRERFSSETPNRAQMRATQPLRTLLWLMYGPSYISHV